MVFTRKRFSQHFLESVGRQGRAAIEPPLTSFSRSAPARITMRLARAWHLTA
jgi:hypothetical protein